VLIAGLPGDVESENVYREEMQQWLEAASAGKVQSIISLSDFSESLKPPPALDCRLLKADRTNFQGLGAMVAGLTNPVMVIAWGHGGRQGSTPVFHVRGPRLTASDFQALAGKVTSPQSRWILFFRGSGAFAGQIAGQDREILASDSGTMFNSDPVSMSLLIKMIKTNPSLSFGKTAEQLGQACAAWYSERHLVSAEEPTLWLGNENPRLLAAATTTNTLASNRAEAPKNYPTSEEPRKNREDLPAVWKDITPEPPSKYPGADAVILRRRIHYTLASSPAVSSEQDEFIQILTLEGKRFGDFDVSYAPPYEDIHFLDCEVLRPDGTVARLDPDAIREEQQESVGDYQVGRRKFFSLPGVVAGAILHVRHRTEWQKFPLPYASMEIPIGRELPALEVAIEVTVPKDASFHFGLEQIAAVDPVIKQTSYGTTYFWKFENLPAPVHEQLAPPREHSRVLISTFPDWAAFAGWYGRISKLTDETTPEITAKAGELSSQSKTDREKVLSVYNYVTGLRYVAVPLGVNSFRPHSAVSVLQNQFGDCKDKANLFNALLHALKIDAHLVLLPRFSQAYDNLPGLAFNHAISQVLLEGEPIWVDTTDDVCRFGLLPPGDPGRKVLVIDGKSSALVRLPQPLARDHTLKMSASVDCTNPKEPLPLSFQAVAQGYPDYELRMSAQENKARAASLPLLASRLNPCSGVFALERQSSTPISALDENFSCAGEGTWIGGTSLNPRQCLLRAPFWIPNQWNAALQHRKSALFLHEGYPLILEEEFTFVLPHEARLEPLPQLVENKAGPLQWRVEWSKVSDDKLAARFHVQLQSGELSNAETADFQKQLRQLFSALGATIAFSTPP